VNFGCEVRKRDTLKHMTEKSLARSVLDWLRAGYPGGVPGPDRVPLLALLRNTPLTEDDIRAVVKELTAQDSPALADQVIDRDEIEAFIEGVTHHDGGPENIQRVADILAAAGFTLEGFDAESS
jgi:hypothetical protein